jgi:uncharacterized OB-fold protein
MAKVEYVAIDDELLSKPLDPPENVNLMGCRCRSCKEVFFGKTAACWQCGSDDIESTALSREGTLYTYTIMRNKPPGDYKGPDPFEPFVAGLVELPEGIAILAPIEGCRFEDIKINMKLELAIETLYLDESGRNVLAYKFRPQNT